MHCQGLVHLEVCLKFNGNVYNTEIAFLKYVQLDYVIHTC